MNNYSPYPVYYTVTINTTTPTNYSTLTGDQAGGADIGTGAQYNRRVLVTGNTAISTNVMSQNETVIINGYPVSFASTDVLSDILTKIQTASKFTKVTAVNSANALCVTLTNTVNNMGYPFYVAESGGTALSKMGIAPGIYSAGAAEVGGNFVNFLSGDAITINGVNIGFSTNTTAVGAISQINGVQNQTGVIAQLSGVGRIQLSSVNSKPYQLGGSNISSLGFTAGNHGGAPYTLTQSENKNRANMRYNQIVSEVEKMATPVFWGSINTTGNQDGNAAPTTLSFTVGFNQVDYVTTVEATGETVPGNILTGAAAVKRSVARGLLATISSNQIVFDPVIFTGTKAANRNDPINTTRLTASGWEVLANLSILENNITVTQIGNL